MSKKDNDLVDISKILKDAVEVKIPEGTTKGQILGAWLTDTCLWCGKSTRDDHDCGTVH